MDSRAAIVTGAGRRIGRGIAEGMHDAGFCVLLHTNVSVADAESVSSALNAVRPNSAVVCCADLRCGDIDGVSLLERCRAVLSSCVKAFGRCDVLVNNASAYLPTPLVDADQVVGVEHQKERDAALESAVDAIVGSNAVAPLFLIRAFAHHCLHHSEATAQRRNRCVVNLCDSMVDRPLLGYTVYTMAKCALEGLTASASVELAPFGIRVNAVAPGLNVLPVDLPKDKESEYRGKVPLGKREGTPKNVADAVLFLVSERAEYITGATINVDGAWSLMR